MIVLYLKHKLLAFRYISYQNQKKEVARIFNGAAKAHALADLSFRVDGKIATIPVSKGEKVNKGDLLAVLDKRDYQIALDDRKAKSKQTYNQYRRGKSMLKKKN